MSDGIWSPPALQCVVKQVVFRSRVPINLERNGRNNWYVTGPICYLSTFIAPREMTPAVKLIVLERLGFFGFRLLGDPHVFSKVFDFVYNCLTRFLPIKHCTRVNRKDGNDIYNK